MTNRDGFGTDRDGFEEITFSTCPECNSEAYYDSAYDFYACLTCGETWSYGVNNDHDDDYPLADEPIFDRSLIQHIERYSMFGRQANEEN